MATRENARATNNFFASATPPLQNYWSHIVNHVPSQIVNYVTLDMLSSPTARGDIITAVGQMKRHVSKKVGFPIWQKSFHDHIIRNREDYEKIAKYIYENPIRWQYDCFYVSDEQAR